MYILLILSLIMILKIGSKIYIVLTKPLSELKKEHYNMNTVNIVRTRLSYFVRKDEQHLIHH